MDNYIDARTKLEMMLTNITHSTVIIREMIQDGELILSLFDRMGILEDISSIEEAVIDTSNIVDSLQVLTKDEGDLIMYEAYKHAEYSEDESY